MESAKKEKQKKVQKTSQQKPEKRAVESNVVCGCGCTTPFPIKKQLKLLESSRAFQEPDKTIIGKI